jgi:lipid II:glycine glycyltransferase (peptidoglycan interpeptide bridge formation enzyme)
MRPLVWRDGGDTPQAAALVLKRKTPGLPFNILYAPKGPLLDPGDVGLRERVLGDLRRLAQEERAIFIKIDPDVVRGRGAEEEEAVEIGRRWEQFLRDGGWRFSDDQIQFRNTVMVDLTRDEEQMLADMKSKTRYNIRYAGRKGVTIRRGTPADFPLLLEMYRETADRDGFAIRPPDYYADAWQSFHDAGMLQPLIAEYQGDALGAVVLVRHGDTATYMYGMSTEKERRRQPNYLLQWEGMVWAKEQGCTRYDMWGAPDEFVEEDPLWGVWRFKNGFAGEVVRHIGAWDYPTRPALYWLYTTAVPRYLNWLRRRSG